MGRDYFSFTGREQAIEKDENSKDTLIHFVHAKM
jgi:hypothetical protein